MGNETSKAAKTTWADTAAAARKLWAAALFSVAAVALMLATAGAASGYTPPPAPSITAPSEGSYEPDGNFVLSGTAPQNTTVKVFEEHPIPGRDPIYVGTATLDGSGRWSLNLGGVVFAKHVYKARVTDHMSNLSPWSNLRTVTVDTPRLLEKQDAQVLQAKQESERLVEEGRRQNLAQESQDLLQQVLEMMYDIEWHAHEVGKMSVDGVSSTERQRKFEENAAAQEKNAALEDATSQLRESQLPVMEDTRELLQLLVTNILTQEHQIIQKMGESVQ